MAFRLTTLSARRRGALGCMTRTGEKPLSLLENDKAKTPERPKDLLVDDINRFDKTKRKKKKRAPARDAGSHHRPEKPVDTRTQPDADPKP